MATQKANVSVPASGGEIFLQAQARTRSLFLALLLWNIRSISTGLGLHCAGAGTGPLLDTFSEVSPKMPCENMSSPGTLGRTEKEGGSVRRKVRVDGGKMLAWENGRGFGKEVMVPLLYQAAAWPFLEHCTLPVSEVLSEDLEKKKKIKGLEKLTYREKLK